MMAMSEVSIPKPQKVDPRVVYCPTDNPNKMPPDMYQDLENSIKKHGFVQPVFVVKGGPDGYKYTIVDGHHRTTKMIELGASHYYAVVSETMEEAQAAADQANRLLARIGLNRIKGTLDLIDVSRDLDLIMKTYSVPIEDVVGTGFDEDEIKALMTATEPTMPEDLMGEIPDAEPPAKVRKSTSKKNLTLKFNSEIDRVRTEEALMAHSQGTDDPMLALMNLLGIAPEEG